MLVKLTAAQREVRLTAHGKNDHDIDHQGCRNDRRFMACFPGRRQCSRASAEKHRHARFKQTVSKTRNPLFGLAIRADAQIDMRQPLCRNRSCPPWTRIACPFSSSEARSRLIVSSETEKTVASSAHVASPSMMRRSRMRSCRSEGRRGLGTILWSRHSYAASGLQGLSHRNTTKFHLNGH